MPETQSQHYTNYGKTENIFSEVKNKTTVSIYPVLLNVVFEFSVRALKHDKVMKGMQI
jgi:hypothetical protein